VRSPSVLPIHSRIAADLSQGIQCTLSPFVVQHSRIAADFSQGIQCTLSLFVVRQLKKKDWIDSEKKIKKGSAAKMKGHTRGVTCNSTISSTTVISEVKTQ
jgi:hypothetical protein